jgi:hypothetical protein
MVKTKKMKRMKKSEAKEGEMLPTKAIGRCGGGPSPRPRVEE